MTISVTLISIITVTSIAISISYHAMKDQLISDRIVSTRWLQDKLNACVSDHIGCVYQLETSRSTRNTLLTWSQTGKMDSTDRLDLITRCNTIISLNQDINAIDLCNLNEGVMIKAARMGADNENIGDKLDFWKENAPYNQTNLVYFVQGDEILACHQMVEFETRKPIALIVIHLRPFTMESTLSDIKSVSVESVAIFNDHDTLLFSDCGQIQGEEMTPMLETVRAQELGEYTDRMGFWFYRSVSRNKLQMLYFVPAETIRSALWPTLEGSLVSAIFAAALAALFTYFFSHAITRPIRDLSYYMRSIALTGDAQGVEAKRRDEIGVLQESFNYMIRRNQELILSEYQSQIEKRNAQIKTLQAQINPHFMYNTLQVIGGMALEKGANNVYEITLALSDIMRYALNFKLDRVPLSEEIRYLESYVLIQEHRFENHIELRTNLETGTEKLQVPKLILQPICENAFRHGFPGRSGDWILEVDSKTEGEDIILLVRDNGVGMNEEELHKIREIMNRDVTHVMSEGSHIGLSNVNMRLRLLYQEEKYGVRIESHKGEGTTVILTMKRIKDSEKNGNISGSDY